MRKLYAAVAVITMLAGFGFSMYSNEKLKEKEVFTHSAGHLKEVFPVKIGDMTSVDKPLGNTEEVAHAASDILDVSEYLHREYTLPDGRSFVVYISYWNPGKSDIRSASRHTPDRCWVSNGWKIDQSSRNNNDSISAMGGPLMDAYYRFYEYSMDFGRKYRRSVWFWHIVNGERYDYRTKDNYTANPFVYLNNMINQALYGSPEQYFIRVDSAEDLHGFLDNKDFQKFLDILGKLVLYRKEPKQNG